MTIDECKNIKPYPHEHRCRYTHGFYCEDCKTFFPKDSEEYIRTEYISSLWMAVNNTNVNLFRDGKSEQQELKDLLKRIELFEENPYSLLFDNVKIFIEEIIMTINKYTKFNEDLYSITIK